MSPIKVVPDQTLPGVGVLRLETLRAPSVLKVEVQRTSDPTGSPSLWTQPGTTFGGAEAKHPSELVVLGGRRPLCEKQSFSDQLINDDNESYDSDLECFPEKALLSEENLLTSEDVVRRSLSKTTPLSSDSVCKKSFIDTFSEKELHDFEDSLYDIIDRIFESEMECMSKPNYIEILVGKILEYFLQDWIDNDICKDNDYDDIYTYVEEFLLQFMDIMENELPLRQYLYTHPDALTKIKHDTITNKITELQSRYQPTQRTPEWYEYRHGLITASSLHKALGSESQINSLIREKNKLYVPQKMNYFSKNPRQWGTVYETISIMIYCQMFSTSISDFGCIQHDKYPIIGASPDGINTDPTSDRYGRMIEVKNIVNREITDKPKEEYWIQMQIQMETCDLDECDFIETRFKEFETESDFYAFDNDKEKQKGIFLCFVVSLNFVQENSLDCDTKIIQLDTSSVDFTDRRSVTSTDDRGLYVTKGAVKPTHSQLGETSPPKYIYMPLDISCDPASINEWIQKTKTEMKPKYTLYTTHYWYLDEFSCILVKRNRLWFQSVLPKIQNTWNLIEISRTNIDNV